MLKGFTLLELIVAMAIIAILIGLSVVGINTVQRSTRDTERLSAFNTINLEIEQYKGTYGSYPTILSVTADDQIEVFPDRPITLKGAAQMVLVGSAPSPTTASSTDYCYDGTASSYVLGVSLENKSSGEFRKSSASLANCSFVEAGL